MITKGQKDMLNKVVFSDEITLWWTKDEFNKSTTTYKVYLDGKFQGETNKTHFSFLGLMRFLKN